MNTGNNNLLLKELLEKSKAVGGATISSNSLRLRPTPARTEEELSLLVQHPEVVSSFPNYA